MTITALPTPPTRDDPANFASRADTFLAALPDFATEANALASAVNADEIAAAASASAANTSASNAASSASAASTSASNAASSASAASASASAAAASFDSFDDRYLGPKSSDPSVDNDGNALIAGALYFNTTANEMRVYTGSAWLAAYLPVGSYATLTGSETLTNKTISADNNTLSGIAASSFVLSNSSGNIDGAAAQKAIPSGVVVGDTDAQTLTNKTLQAPNITTGLTLTGSAGTAGQTILSQGSGQPPIWGTTSSASSGITTTNPMSSDLVLTNASTQVQVVVPNALTQAQAQLIQFSRSVYLPDATTITSPNNPVFIIRNNWTAVGATSGIAAIQICVRRTDGTLVTIINPGGYAEITLTNNSTARGEWAAKGNLLSWSRNFGTAPSNSSGGGPTLELSNGNYMIAMGQYMYYVSKTGIMQATSFSSNIIGLEEIDSTHVLLVHTDNTTLYARYVTLNADGSTTLASPVTISVAIRANWHVSLAKLTASTYVVVYADTSNTTIRGVVITVTGSTVAFGSIQSLFTGINSPASLTTQSAVGYSGTQAIVAFGGDYTGYMAALTVSGTTITAGSVTTLFTTGATQVTFSAAFMQNSVAVLLHAYDSGYYARACTISGTTITATGAAAISMTANTSTNFYRRLMLSNSVALYTSFQATTKAYHFAISAGPGPTISVLYGATSTASNALGIVLDKIKSAAFGYTNAISYSADYNRVEADLNLYMRTFTTTGTSLPRVIPHGDLIGTGRAVANGLGGLNNVLATSGGVVFTNYDSIRYGLTYKLARPDLGFTENYGQPWNTVFEDFNDNIIVSYSLPLWNNLGIMKTQANYLGFVEVAI
jgi:hypothetical protein